MQEPTADLVVYVLVRTDLPSLNPGKAMSQVHHAGVQMMSICSNHYWVKTYIEQGVAQGAAGFNTTLVLGDTLDGINNRIMIARAASDSVAICNTVTDPSYPFWVESLEIANLIPQDERTKIIKTMPHGHVLMVREEVTCAWFLGDRNDVRFRSIFEGLDLHP
jgi:hypothetical protein